MFMEFRKYTQAERTNILSPYIQDKLKSAKLNLIINLGFPQNLIDSMIPYIADEAPAWQLRMISFFDADPEDLRLTLEDAIKEIGINVTGLRKDDKVHTTLALVHTYPDGDRDFSFYRNPGADMKLNKEEICEGKIVLFNTNWYKTRGTDEFFHHPYVNGDVAKYLVDNGVRFIGIDTINADQTGGTEFPVHDLFSEKRLMIGENWAFFDQIDFERPYVIALPMKLIGCDGSPVRAIAVQWEEE